LWVFVFRPAASPQKNESVLLIFIFPFIFVYKNVHILTEGFLY
jgi:hypothetical protein